MKHPHIQRYPTNAWTDAEDDNVPELANRDTKYRERPRTQRMPLATKAEWDERPGHKTKKNATWRYAGPYEA